MIHKEKNDMRKIIVIGCPGAGKSTFSRKLSAMTGIPLYHLDLVWHKEDRSTVSRDEFDRQLAEIMSGEEWIIDGNYKRTLPVRLQEADTVFFLDYPLEVCLDGAMERLGKDRPDIPWRIDYELDEDFRQWILDYPKDQLPVIYALLETFRGKVFRFRAREEAEKYLESL